MATRKQRQGFLCGAAPFALALAMMGTASAQTTPAPTGQTFPNASGATDVTAISADGSVVAGSIPYNSGVGVSTQAVTFLPTFQQFLLGASGDDTRYTTQYGSTVTGISADGRWIAGYYGSATTSAHSAFVYDRRCQHLSG